MAKEVKQCLAISPVVVCPFEGRAAQNNAQWQWIGGGARGEGRLKLLPLISWN